eukprot:scaffold2200_cov413-Prasinococcus_capsulatus_cf.AAC.11
MSLTILQEPSLPPAGCQCLRWWQLRGGPAAACPWVTVPTAAVLGEGGTHLQRHARLSCTRGVCWPAENHRAVWAIRP